jgi:hypothetical protein
MNRSTVERELKKVGITLRGWVPILECDSCKRRWEPFTAAVGTAAPTARFDYWKCRNGCNTKARLGHEIQTAIPKYIVLNDIPGMVFGEEDLKEFEGYVRSMDATEIPNRGNM